MCCAVVEAKNVLAKDANGKSDPYVSIAVGGDVCLHPFLFSLLLAASVPLTRSACVALACE
jgi:hypothetical protein